MLLGKSEVLVVKLDTDALKSACYEVARNTKWATHPVDTDDIKRLADELYQISSQQAEFVAGESREPDLVSRAVRYLAHTHAIPPMEDDTRWFGDMLEALLELACPTTGMTWEAAAFFYDIETGITVSRALIDSNEQ